MTISVGENGSVSTVYNVGRIDKDALPNGKIKTIYSGSKANSASIGISISQNPEKSTTSLKKVSEKNGSHRSALPKTDTDEMISMESITSCEYQLE